jgi:hypothetical protein
MKKNILIFGMIVTTYLILSVSPTYAQFEIAGWWKARMIMQQGDFVTGRWDQIPGSGKHASYLYILLSSSTYGLAYLFLWDGAEGKYIKEDYTFYTRNNIVVLSIPTTLDANGYPINGGTIVLRLYGSNMKGYYTLFDMETAGTPDQFVRMCPVEANRITPDKVPEDVAELIP